MFSFYFSSILQFLYKFVVFKSSTEDKRKEKANEDIKKTKDEYPGKYKREFNSLFPFLSSLSLFSFVNESYTMNCIVELQGTL